MKIKTTDLQGKVLDWLVATCEGTRVKFGVWEALWICDKNVFGEDRCIEGDEGASYHPSRNWALGGPIIEREGIALWPDAEGGYFASSDEGAGPDRHGETYLIAAMRCYVASKLGDEVDVPDELMEDK
jgi:Protein of unknown function (DUF2591)